MPPLGETKLPAAQRSRKSIGAHTNIRKSADKENVAADLGASLAAGRAKSRSKSLGPGGLDALRQSTGNRRASLATSAKLPRSILKPTISALPEIPQLKKSSSTLANSKTPVSQRSSGSSHDDSTGSKVAVRSEEEQQAAAREREERDRRDARRKSLANRRVSFAAEATLHTFHDIDYLQDSTASTDSTRRTSSATNQTANVSAEATDRPQITHQEHSSEQNNAHQSGRQLNSGATPNYETADEDTVTSIIYSSDSEPADMVEEIIEDEDSSSESDDGTMMTVEEVTGTSVGSAGSAVSGRSDVSGNESSTLDEALRIAAQRAGTQRLDEEQSDDAEEEVIPSFGWIKKGTQTHQQSNAQLSEEENHSDNETEMDMDMDVTNAVGGIIRQDVQQSDREEDMSMEVTRALGGILPQSKPSEGNLFAVYGHDEPSDEATMELTTAIGGIRQSQPEDASELLDDEDMSMEFTTVMGGVLARQKRASVGTARRKSVSQQTEADDVTMDMTVGLGRIVLGSDINNDDNDATVGMDMTQALGGVISNAEDKNRTLRKRIMEEEADRPNSPKAAVIAALSQPSPQKRVSPRRKPQVSVESSDTDNRAFQGKGLRRSIGPQSVPMEKNRAEAYTPSPSRTRTRPGSGSSKRSTPGSHRQPSQSPSRSNTLPITTPARNTPTQLKSSSSSLFQTDTETGSRTPLIVLTPQPRRLSGLGADRSGLGSPRVTALLERRTSIGEAATSFTPGKRAVAFQDPKELSHEVDRERQLENDREDGRTILEREADGADDNREAPVNLRDMIDSLSPKRIPLKGRKSLHVGSAQGLLGKRPAELDDDDDSEENDGVKRLKGHQGSPVKNVRLQNPPSKSETTGRFNKSTRRSLEPPGQITTPTLSSPTKGAQNTTPRNQTRFRNVDDDHSTQGINFNATPKDPDQLAAEAEEGRIHLQDFLNMTSIRFMELTTTKRRHTIAPTNFADGTGSDGQDDMCLERCVVAGACTVPTLELYQHSCRELKKYISEGRRIVKEIEADTFEDNPPLFREYLSASPDVKTLMDNQFKNVKTHARLLSKAMWYEWRMKLQDGLKEGLIKISEGMTRDEEHLQQQQQLLESVVPTMVSRYDALQEESESLQDIAREIADCDPAELQGARDELNDLSESIAQKKRLIAQLRRQFEESEQEVHELATRKQDCITEIQGFEKVRDECRGWTGAEVEALKARVTAIEAASGWGITGITGTVLSMTYNREIELVFDIAAFRPHQPQSTIDLWYIAESREDDASPKTAEKEFFLQRIRDHIRSLPQNQTSVSEVLRIVAAGWDKARFVSSQVSRINVSFPTKVTQTSDSSVMITSSLLLAPLETRVEVTLNLQATTESESVAISLAPQAHVVYGEHFNVTKMVEFIASRVGDAVCEGKGVWSDILVELQQKLIARGRK